MYFNDKQGIPVRERQKEVSHNTTYSFVPSPKCTTWLIATVGAVAIGVGVTAYLLHRHNLHQKKRHIIPLPESILGLEVGSYIRLNLHFSSQLSSSLCIVAEKQQFPHFVCDVRDKRLRIYCTPQGRRKKKFINATLVLPELNTLSLTGNACIEVEGLNKTNEFTLLQYGGEVKTLQVEARRFTFNATGDYTSDIAFSQGELNMTALGRGYCHFALAAKSVTSRISGECSCTLVGVVDDFTLHVAGRAEVLAETLRLPMAQLHCSDEARASFSHVSRGEIALSGKSQLTLSEKLDKKVALHLQESSAIYFIEDEAPSTLVSEKD